MTTVTLPKKPTPPPGLKQKQVNYEDVYPNYENRQEYEDDQPDMVDDEIAAKNLAQGFENLRNALQEALKTEETRNILTNEGQHLHEGIAMPGSGLLQGKELNIKQLLPHLQNQNVETLKSQSNVKTPEIRTEPPEARSTPNDGVQVRKIEQVEPSEIMESGMRDKILI